LGPRRAKIPDIVGDMDQLPLPRWHLSDNGNEGRVKRNMLVFAEKSVFLQEIKKTYTSDTMRRFAATANFLIGFNTAKTQKFRNSSTSFLVTTPAKTQKHLFSKFKFVFQINKKI
jgi:hypothetical protein